MASRTWAAIGGSVSQERWSEFGKNRSIVSQEMVLGAYLTRDKYICESSRTMARDLGCLVLHPALSSGASLL